MSRFPLNGLARPLATAAATAALVATSAGLTTLPAVATPASATSTTSAASPSSTTSNSSTTSTISRFAAALEAHPDAAWGCRLSDTPGSRGLKQWPSSIRSRVAAQFGILDIGGYRPGSGTSDHHSGRAIDIMVRGDRGTEIADWVRAHAEELDVKYVIWQQGYWQPGMSDYRRMKDRGSDTANHWDHVHVSFHRGSGSCPAS